MSNQVKASNVYLVCPTVVYENAPIQMPAYENEDGTFQTFQENYPNARKSVDEAKVCFAVVIRAQFIPQLELLATSNDLTFSFGVSDADVLYLDIETALDLLDTEEWKGTNDNIGVS